MKNIKLYNGGCLEVMDKLIEKGVIVDAIITDPPYGMDYYRHIPNRIHNKIKNDKSLEWVDDVVTKSFNIIKDNGYMFVFCSWHNIDIFKQKYQNKFHLKNILIWNKNGNGMGDLNTNFGVVTEFCLFFVKKCKLKQNHLNGKRDNNILNFSRSGNKNHPTEKPIALMEYLATKITNENDIILDCFMGSGTTGVACINTNRNFIGIELDKKYYDISVNRIKKAYIEKQKELF